MPYQPSVADNPILVFVLWPRIALPEVLCGEMHCHDVKSTYEAKDFALFDGCAAVDITNLERRLSG